MLISKLILSVFLLNMLVYVLTLFKESTKYLYLLIPILSVYYIGESLMWNNALVKSYNLFYFIVIILIIEFCKILKNEKGIEVYFYNNLLLSYLLFRAENSYLYAALCFSLIFFMFERFTNGKKSTYSAFISTQILLLINYSEITIGDISYMALVFVTMIQILLIMPIYSFGKKLYSEKNIFYLYIFLILMIKDIFYLKIHNSNFKMELYSDMGLLITTFCGLFWSFVIIKSKDIVKKIIALYMMSMSMNFMFLTYSGQRINYETMANQLVVSTIFLVVFLNIKNVLKLRKLIFLPLLGIVGFPVTRVFNEKVFAIKTFIVDGEIARAYIFGLFFVLSLVLLFSRDILSNLNKEGREKMTIEHIVLMIFTILIMLPSEWIKVVYEKI